MSTNPARKLFRLDSLSRIALALAVLSGLVVTGLGVLANGPLLKLAREGFSPPPPTARPGGEAKAVFASG